MANTKVLQIKRTTVSGRTPNVTSTANSTYIYPGELAVNLTDKKLYTSNGSAVVEFGTNLTSLSIGSNLDVSGNVVISGDLTVSGNVTYINSQTLNIGDNIFVLNADVTGTPSENSGMEVNRGTYANVQFLWNETDSRWTTNTSALHVGNTLVVANNTTITGTANVSTAINVGANVNLSTSSINVGNSTVNSFINNIAVNSNTVNAASAVNVGANVNLSTSQINVGNSTTNSVLNSTSITIGNTVVNTTTIAISTNVVSNTTALKIGNTTVNAVVNSTSIVIGNTVANTTTVAVGANSYINTTTFFVGNSTVNSYLTSSQLNVGANVVLTTSNITVGNSTVNLAVNSTSFSTAGVISSGNVNITGTANVSVALNVGANVNANTTAIKVGNTTVNSVLTQSSLAIGNTVANTTGLYVGANLYANMTSVFIGNTTVNTVINSTSITIGNTVSNTTAIAIGANSYINATAHFVGNSTVNTALTSTTIFTSGTIAGGNTNITGTANVTTAINVGANVNLGTTYIDVGNSTVNTTITDITVSTNTVNAISAVNIGANVNLTTTSFNVGNSTVNTSIVNSGVTSGNVFVGTSTTNTVITPTSITTGNTTVNTVINSTTVSTNTVNANSALNVGSNVNLTTTYVNVGNSTINTFINSTSISVLTLSGGNGSFSGVMSMGNTNIIGTANISANLTANNVRTYGSVQIDGDLVVGGNTVTLNVTNLALEDSMIYLNANSTVSNPDLGFAGNYNDGTYRHAGFFRDATDGVFKVFDNYVPEPDASAFIDTANNTFRIADFQANNTTLGSLVVTNISYLGGAAGAESLKVAKVTSAINSVEIGGGATGVSPYIYAAGSESNPLKVSGKGNFGVSFFSGAGATKQFDITHTSTAVNYLQVTGAISTSGPIISAQGSDTNVDLNVVAKGTGVINLKTDNGLVTRITDNSQTSIVNFLVMTGANTSTSPKLSTAGADTNIGLQVATKGTGSIQFYSNNDVEQVRITHTSTAVNYLSLTGAVTTSGPIISSQGYDTHIPLNLYTKGSESFHFYTNNGAHRQLKVAHTSSAVNYLEVTGGATGTAPSLVVGSGSSDTNVDFTLSAKGTGVVHSTTPLQVQTDTVVTTKTLTTTATTADQVIGAFAGATFRSAEFVIQAIDATGTKYQKTKILAIHNGSTADYTEYGNVNIGGDCGTFGITYSGGNLNLTVTPATTNSTVFKAICLLTKV